MGEAQQGHGSSGKATERELRGAQREVESPSKLFVGPSPQRMTWKVILVKVLENRLRTHPKMCTPTH